MHSVVVVVVYVLLTSADHLFRSSCGWPIWKPLLPLRHPNPLSLVMGESGPVDQCISVLVHVPSLLPSF